MAFNDGSLHLETRKLVISFQHIASESFVSFKAFVTTFEDRFESNWSSEDVYGRMDPIETFQGTKRTINLSWEVPSANLKEAQDNLAKADLLMNMLYPAYESVHGGAGTIAASPLLRLKFANLISQPGAEPKSDVAATGLVGRVGGFTYVPTFDHGTFYEGGSLYPQTITLNCDFTVFHTHRLGWRIANEGLQRQKGFPHGADKAPGDEAALEALPAKIPAVDESRTGAMTAPGPWRSSFVPSG